ncbi:MAG: purine-nucleoside phosphorylase [Bacilli bacterium]|nr:purine-nucleoside phosphorylase [Bacilli bacterium]
MEAVHMNSKKEEIADIVLLPGDPLRAKYIADNFLNNVKLVNNIRNMLAFTGYYKNRKITVMGSGMGIPSVAIYAHELYKIYDVKKIIRIGTAGAYSPEVKVRDIILATNAYSPSNFAYGYRKINSHLVNASEKLNKLIIETGKTLNTKIKTGTLFTSEIFDVYQNIDHLKEEVPQEIKPLASEMEAFGLFHLAEVHNKEAACIVSISDSKFEENVDLSPEERQTNLNQMITLALETVVKE